MRILICMGCSFQAHSDEEADAHVCKKSEEAAKKHMEETGSSKNLSQEQ